MFRYVRCVACVACVYVRRKDVHKVADKYSADLDLVIDRATTILAEEFSDSEQLARRRDQFVGQLSSLFYVN